MRIDIGREELFSLAEVAKRLPRRRGDKKTHVSTLHRWATTGLRGARLETVQVGGVKCTTTAALNRFFTDLAAQRPSNQRGTSVIVAPDVESALDRAGI